MAAAKHSVCNAALPLFFGEERIVIIFVEQETITSKKQKYIMFIVTMTNLIADANNNAQIIEKM